MCFSCISNFEVCMECESLFCLNCDFVLDKQLTDKYKPESGFYEGANYGGDIFDANLISLKNIHPDCKVHIIYDEDNPFYHKCKNCRIYCLDCHQCRTLAIEEITDSEDEED